MPIRWRLTLFIALAIGAILLILGVVLYFLLREALLTNVEDTARARALTAARNVRSEGDLDDIEQLTLDGVFVIVRDGQGRALSETASLASGAEDPACGSQRSDINT